MNATSTRNVSVEAGGTQVVGHGGLHALGAFADRLSIGETMSATGVVDQLAVGMEDCPKSCRCLLA